MANISRAEDIRLIVDQLKNGGLILYPTDTIWGIGCDATNEQAIEKLYTLKQRPQETGFVLLVNSMDMLQEYVELLAPKAGNLIEFYERPLTIVYENPINLPAKVMAKDGSVAIRVTKDPFCQQIIEAFGGPVVATSANIHGAPFAVNYSEVSTAIREGVDYIAWTNRIKELKGRSPSAIVKINDKEELVFIRK